MNYHPEHSEGPASRLCSPSCLRNTTLHLTTDHVYNGQRITLESAVINWLNQLPK